MNPKDYECKNAIKTFTFPLKINFNITYIAEDIEANIAERCADELNLTFSEIKDEWSDEVLKEVIKELQSRIEKRGN